MGVDLYDRGHRSPWSRNGSELIYVAPDNTLMATQVNGKGTAFEVGAVTPLLRSRMGVGRYDYAVSSDGQRALGLPRHNCRQDFDRDLTF